MVIIIINLIITVIINRNKKGKIILFRRNAECIARKFFKNGQTAWMEKSAKIV